MPEIVRRCNGRHLDLSIVMTVLVNGRQQCRHLRPVKVEDRLLCLLLYLGIFTRTSATAAFLHNFAVRLPGAIILSITSCSLNIDLP